MSDPTHIFELIEKRSIARDVLLCGLRVHEGGEFNFRPGQYIVLQIPQDKEALARSFSIASGEKTGEINIIVKLQQSGAASNFFRDAQVGHKLIGSGPMGDFIVRSDTVPVVMIAAGAGIAPLHAMISHLLGSQGFSESLHLLFYKEEDGYEELVARFSRFTERYEHFHFDIITDERPSTHIIRPQNYSKLPAFYLCGGTQFVRDMKQQLRAVGFPDEVIHRER